MLNRRVQPLGDRASTGRGDSKDGPVGPRFARHPPGRAHEALARKRFDRVVDARPAQRPDPPDLALARPSPGRSQSRGWDLRRAGPGPPTRSAVIRSSARGTLPRNANATDCGKKWTCLVVRIGLACSPRELGTTHRDARARLARRGDGHGGSGIGRAAGRQLRSLTAQAADRRRVGRGGFRADVRDDQPGHRGGPRGGRRTDRRRTSSGRSRRRAGRSRTTHPGAG